MSIQKEAEERIRQIIEVCVKTKDLQDQLSNFLVNTEKEYSSFEVACSLLVIVSVLGHQRNIDSDGTAALAKAVSLITEKKIQMGEVDGYYARGEGRVDFTVYNTDKSVN